MDQFVSLLHQSFQHYYSRTFLLSSLKNVNSIYIHPSAVRNNTDEIIPWNYFEAYFKSTISQSKTVILGDSGTGKSTLALTLVKELWNDYYSSNSSKYSKLIPIHINVSLLPGKKLSEEYFPLLQIFRNQITELNLKEEVILSEFRTKRICLILDGYEQLTSFNNFSWASDFAHILIFSRPEAFSNKHEVNKVFPLYEVIFLNSFNQSQISDFLINVVNFLKNIDFEQETKDCKESGDPWLLTKQFTSSHHAWEHGTHKYREWMDFVLPELGELAQNPLILTFLVQILPLVVEEEIEKCKGNENFAKKEVQRLLNTEVGIYDQFTSKWFDFQAQNILKSNPSLKSIESYLISYLEAYAQNLAVRLISKGGGEFKDGIVNVSMAEEWNLWIPNMKRELYEMSQTDEHRSLFPECVQDALDKKNPKRHHLLALRSGCFLKCLLGDEGNVFQFLHLRVIEYFASREIFKGLGGELRFILQNFGVKPCLFSFNRDSIRHRKYSKVLEHLVNWAKINTEFRQLLLDVVKESKNISSIALMSSNAFTVLTRVQHVWSHEDFSYCNLGDADMSYCEFFSCDFRGCDMNRALLTGSWFYMCKLQGANMVNCELGIKTSFRIQDNIKFENRKRVTHFQHFYKPQALQPTILFTHVNSLREFIPDDAEEIIHFNIPDNYESHYFDMLDKTNVLVFFRVSQEDGFRTPALFLGNIKKKKKTKSKVVPAAMEKIEFEELLKLKDPRNEVFTIKFDKLNTSITKNVSLTVEGNQQGFEYVLDILSIPIKESKKQIVCYQSSPLKYDGWGGCSHTDPKLFFCYNSFNTFSVTDNQFNFKLLSNLPIQGFHYAFDANQALLATTCDFTLIIFDLKNWKVLYKQLLPIDSDDKYVSITCMSFSRDGHYLVCGVDDFMYFWNREKGDPIKINVGSSRQKYSVVDSLVFCPWDIDLVAFTFGGGRVFIVNMAYGEIIQTIADTEQDPKYLAFKDKYHLSCMSYYGDIFTRRVTSASEESFGVPRSKEVMYAMPNYHQLVNNRYHIYKTKLSPYGRYIAVYKHDKMLVRKIGDKTPIQHQLLLFRISENTGKRNLVFCHEFNTDLKYPKSGFEQIHVKFWKDSYLILMYFGIVKMFSCKEGKSIQVNNIPNDFNKMWFDQDSFQAIFKVGPVLNLYILAEENYGQLECLFFKSIELTLELGELFMFTKEHGDGTVTYFVYMFPKETSDIFYLWDFNTDSSSELIPINMSKSISGRHISSINTLCTFDNKPMQFYISVSGTYYVASVLAELCIANLETVEYHNAITLVKLIQKTDLFLCTIEGKILIVGTILAGKIDYKFMFRTFHSFYGLEAFVKDSNLIILLTDDETITCLEVSIDKLREWNGAFEDFSGWKILWVDKYGEKFSLLYSLFTNTILSRATDWTFLSQKFHTKGEITYSLNTYTSRASLFNEVSSSPKSIFSQDPNLILKDNEWRLFVFAKIKHIKGLRRALLDNHSGLIIEGILHNRHFAVRTELGRFGKDQAGIKMISLSTNLRKYKDFVKEYKAKEYYISGDDGKALIEDILKEKQQKI